MSPFRCAGENGMRVESWATFRTETQRRRRRRDKPALHRGEYIRNISICCTFLGVFISFVCGRNRGPGGELLPSSLHRGDAPRKDGNAMEMQWQNAGLRQWEEAALQPGSNGRPNEEGVMTET